MQSTPSLPFVRLVAFVLAFAAPVAAQGWAQRTPSSAPLARFSTASAFDVHRGVVVQFGGNDGSPTPLDDTNEWNGTAWIPRPGLVRPQRRWGHAMAFDSRRGRTVLFGGFRNVVGMVNDTWEWDGVSWQQRAIPNPPPARAYHGMAYDAARGVCVVFGGSLDNGTALADTWEYDGSAWVQRTSPNAPSPRMAVAMAWDEVRRQTLLFGGGDGVQVFGDTWWWTGTAWVPLPTPVSPSPRWAAQVAHDGNCGRTVLFGGADAGFAANYGDAWEWTGVAWSQVAGTQPPARHGATMVHDAQRRQFVLWGGRDATGPRNDTWELAPSCSRTMTMVAPAVVGQTAQFRYDYPGAAGNLHFCWTLITPRQTAAFAVPIPGFPSIGLCRVDLFNVLLDPAQFLDGSGALVTAVPIPNNPAFVGFQFDVQSVDLDFFTLALRWAETDVEATTGPLAAPMASFTATPTSGNAPLVVQFTDTSTQFPTAWQWDFNNDGTIDSTQQNPSWTYTSNGVYSVRLVTTNSVGIGAVTRSNLVIVGPLLPNPLLNMLPIAPGTFQMGSAAYISGEQPVHQVTLSNPFWMAKYEVTQAQYQSVMGSNPSYFQGASVPNAPQRPVEWVGWNDAVAYCQALSVTEQAAGRVPAGYHYRLPTEAEWEYCCRAGTNTEWNTGMSLSTSQANFQGSLANSTYRSGQTAAVGSYAPNAFGLHDMHGNVSEWCLDSYSQYAPGPVTDPFVTGGANRMIRGGSWENGCDAFYCRSAKRHDVMPGGAGSWGGFRIVLAPILLP